MRGDAHDLRRFYASPLGRAARGSIAIGLSRVWRPIPNERLVGLGYALPWLADPAIDAERTLALMPAAQGARRWPKDGPSRTAIVYEEELPLSDASVDRILLVHALEHSEQPVETLREAHRVLAANGRLVVVVPHRRGLWARFEHTPFGTGRPWSRRQLAAVLEEAGFRVADVNDALMFPPVPHPVVGRLWRPLDWTGRKAFSTFSGAILAVGAKGPPVEGVPATRLLRRPVAAPEWAAEGATGRCCRTALPIGRNQASDGSRPFAVTSL